MPPPPPFFILPLSFPIPLVYPLPPPRLPKFMSQLLPIPFLFRVNPENLALNLFRLLIHIGYN